MAGAPMVTPPLTYKPGDQVVVARDIPLWSGGYVPAGAVLRVAATRRSQGRSRYELLDLCTEEGRLVVCGCVAEGRVCPRETACK